MVQKVAVKRDFEAGFAIQRLENSLYQPVPFSNWGKIK